ncbi:hypothetical protein NFHSH190041_08720 [Shewanella sp. NFH-SH190041]|uniref:hypothetical protein n=1 Tax=Shewanella sp. NFH-SH190041 TaxID=2950245 RepID=UPI0021C496E2|nr:hypothetical protein [Shewanella sp. NFH-SH190041]BDM63420.1 hypothetical protein NFHSH190041_08720 [Shewanella sp. NFH-SH190041]
MKLIPLAGMTLAASLLLSACQSAPQATASAPVAPLPQVSTTANAQPTYPDMSTYGQAMGCKAAFQNQGTPETGWVDAPKVPGSKTDYLNGWQQGFAKCRIGLGPVQLPVQK